jgi:hypothetical protein
MHVEAVLQHNGEKVTISKDIKRINVIYVGQDKDIHVFECPFIVQGEWCSVTFGGSGVYVFDKKHICWKYEPKRLSLKKFSAWDPYVIMMDSKAHVALMP